MAYHLVEVAFELIENSICENVITGGQGGNLDTTDATCFKTQDAITGRGCANMYERTVSVTINGQGTPVTGCGSALPSKSADDYYVFEIGAGGVPWASVYWW
jgi:hypothetical protein